MIGSRVYCMCVGVALLFFVAIFPHFFSFPSFDFLFIFSSHPLSVCALACFMTITMCCLVYPAGICVGM